MARVRPPPLDTSTPFLEKKSNIRKYSSSTTKQIKKLIDVEYYQKHLLKAYSELLEDYRIIKWTGPQPGCDFNEILEKHPLEDQLKQTMEKIIHRNKFLDCEIETIKNEHQIVKEEFFLYLVDCGASSIQEKLKEKFKKIQKENKILNIKTKLLEDENFLLREKFDQMSMDLWDAQTTFEDLRFEKRNFEKLKNQVSQIKLLISAC